MTLAVAAASLPPFPVAENVIDKKPITGIMLDASYYPSNLRIPGFVDPCRHLAHLVALVEALLVVAGVLPEQIGLPAPARVGCRV
jgi:hypothetical protein